MKRVLVLAFSLLWLQWSPLSMAASDLSTLLQLIDYVGVDYSEAVADGEVINTVEYAEMEEFSDRIRAEIAQLEAGQVRDALDADAARLRQGIAERADPALIVRLTQSLRQQLMNHYPLVLTPRRIPDLQAAAGLYQVHCAACHGADGSGEGPAGAAMDPAPTDFLDPGRARQRSVYGLYNTITLGVDGTGMTSFAQLSDADRWALAFYVGSLYADQPLLAAGEQAWRHQPLELEPAVTQSPAELGEQRADGEALAVWLRTQPQLLFSGKPTPLDVAEDNLTASIESARNGDLAAAERLAVTAYLEGFELTEAALSNVDAGLMREVERAMMAYRRAITHGSMADVEQRYEQAQLLLERSRSALEGAALSPQVAFSSSLIILLREGLEAILVLAAMIAFLTKTGRRDALVYVHAGWIGALVAGLATWAVSSYLITISGAAREVTEGFTALFAAVILFYVGFWMHRNANAERWNQYLQGQIEAALSRRTLWTLALVSFLAVYREVFETVLFYQALWAQAAADAHQAIWSGGLVAAAILLVVTWAVARFGMRLPLKQFFSISALLLIALALIFIGKGIAALQEAGKLPHTPIDGPTIDLLGIYPNMQGLALQLALLLLAAALLWSQRRRVRAA